jgi:polyferredoxin
MAIQRFSSDDSVRLAVVRLVHTIAWAFFAGCIVAIPIVSWLGEHRVAALLAAVVFGEVIVLALNGWSCPLTAVAARYTEDRRDNFDIYLPEWLARYNKHVFGPLYAAGLVFAILNWLRT